MKRSLAIAIVALGGAGGPASSQGANQYFEQYRTAESVKGSCEKLVGFSNSIQDMMRGSWINRVSQEESTDGSKEWATDSTRVVNTYSYNAYLPGGLSVNPVVQPYKRHGSGECTDCCVHTANHERVWTVGNRDEMGGVEGSYRGSVTYGPSVENPEYYKKYPHTTDISCDASGAKNSSGKVIISVPVKEDGNACRVDMPTGKLVDADGSIDEFRLIIISPTVIKRVMSDGEVTFNKQ